MVSIEDLDVKNSLAVVCRDATVVYCAVRGRLKVARGICKTPYAGNGSVDAACDRIDGICGGASIARSRTVKHIPLFRDCSPMSKVNRQFAQ